MDAVEYYNKIKPSYERLYGEEQKEKIDEILRLIEVKPNQKIIDVGAGAGLLEKILKQNMITALEPSELADLIPKRENIKIIRKRLEKFSTKEKFDLVFCITVLQDIEKEKREDFIKRLFSLCKKEGFILISVLKRSGIDLDDYSPVSKKEIGNDVLYIFEKR